MVLEVTRSTKGPPEARHSCRSSLHAFKYCSPAGNAHHVTARLPTNKRRLLLDVSSLTLSLSLSLSLPAKFQQQREPTSRPTWRTAINPSELPLRVALVRRARVAHLDFVGAACEPNRLSRSLRSPLFIKMAPSVRGGGEASFVFPPAASTTEEMPLGEGGWGCARGGARHLTNRPGTASRSRRSRIYRPLARQSDTSRIKRTVPSQATGVNVLLAMSLDRRLGRCRSCAVSRRSQRHLAPRPRLLPCSALSSRSVFALTETTLPRHVNFDQRPTCRCYLTLTRSASYITDNLALRDLTRLRTARLEEFQKT